MNRSRLEVILQSKGESVVKDPCGRQALWNDVGWIVEIIKMDQTDTLRNILFDIETIPENDWAAFQLNTKIRSLNKGDFLLRKGQVCKGIYIVLKGSLRMYHIADSKEINTSFSFENDLVRELESLSTERPSEKFIQAMEDTEVAFISKLKLTGLYEKAPSLQKLGRKILERMAVTEQKYASLFTIYSPKERYQYILTNHPELVQRIPLQYLASYLGIARETLSRIRKRV